MAGGNAHQRAVDRSAKSRLAKEVTETVLDRISEMLPTPNTEKPRGLWRSLLDFFEQPLVTLPLGIIGAIVGALFFAPILFLCGVCILLGFHQAGIVKGRKSTIQIPAYLVVGLLSMSVLYGIHLAIQRGLSNANTSISELFTKKLDEWWKLRPSETHVTNGGVTVQPAVGAAEKSEDAKKSLPPQRNPMPKPDAQSQRPYDLTGERRKKFLALLSKTQTEPRDILRIGCLSWSEHSCTAAGQFLMLFSEAGWTIDSNRVFRIDTSIPKEGVTIVKHIDKKPNLPPHLGIWGQLDESEKTIFWAFQDMELTPSSSVDDAIPVGTLGIVFGPEPTPD
jgi:hypothetical protein